MKCVVLAGGGGLRLWPLSRKKHPKQFLKIGDSNTMFQETVLRNSELFSDFLIVSNYEFRHMINKQFRGIDRATDVLSFPMLEYEVPGDFSFLEEENSDDFNPDTGEALLGDIIISVDKVLEQAESYGHSVEREYAFLITHSMLHLFGYDHMQEEEAKVMEDKQRDILLRLNILRDKYE